MKRSHFVINIYDTLVGTGRSRKPVSRGAGIPFLKGTEPSEVALGGEDVNWIKTMIIREAKLEDAEAIARVHVDSWRTTYQGIIPESYIAKLSYQKRQERWQKMLSDNQEQDRQHFIYVVENKTRQIIAFADGGLARSSDSIYQGELYAIYILEAYHRQDIGKKLIEKIAEKLSQSGLESMLVWVLEDNPACQFYQALGAQQVKQQQIEFEGVKLNEIAYGWIDTKVLMAT